MARIAGVDLPAKKAGRDRPDLYLRHRADPVARRCCTGRGVDPDKKVGDLTEDEVNHIRTMIEDEGAVEGDLRKEVSMNIKRLIEMGSYRGSAASPRSAGARPAHAHQRPHPQGPAPRHGGEQEESDAKT